ncbi:MAG: hypothetical protein SFV23_16900 [Planctomycetaceae bacterium]|nr:hypothetical protein [Planctomycetaceae bacterium]
MSNLELALKAWNASMDSLHDKLEARLTQAAGRLQEWLANEGEIPTRHGFAWAHRLHGNLCESLAGEQLALALTALGVPAEKVAALLPTLVWLLTTPPRWSFGRRRLAIGAAFPTILPPHVRDRTILYELLVTHRIALPERVVDLHDAGLDGYTPGIRPLQESFQPPTHRLPWGLVQLTGKRRWYLDSVPVGERKCVLVCPLTSLQIKRQELHAVKRLIPPGALSAIDGSSGWDRTSPCIGMCYEYLPTATETRFVFLHPATGQLHGFGRIWGVGRCHMQHPVEFIEAIRTLVHGPLCAA